MDTAQEMDMFLREGYVVVEDLVSGEHLRLLQDTFDQSWQAEKATSIVRPHKTLKYRPFVELLEYGPILQRMRAIFGDQVQLISYDLLRQGPHNTKFPDRDWHRDFSFAGDRPLAVQTVLMLDDTLGDGGPTYAVPRSHLGDALPALEEITTPLPGEAALPLRAGSAIFLNGSLWHSGARNDSDHLRRGLYIYFGYWWLKPYFHDRPIPWQALDGASPQLMEILGVKQPDWDLHRYRQHLPGGKPRPRASGS
jgi:ectoine hydroxylase-related dioxygenase (phytanoyl-CoA dioxygenase family)